MSSDRNDLLIGYDLLANTLSEESRLKALGWYRKLTFRRPVEEVETLLETLSTASRKRRKEHEDLRRLPPDVSGRPQSESPIGEAINSVATDMGKGEMLDLGSGFDLRFLLLQAQATRMVAAIAEATAHFEPNAQRRAWLESFATPT